MIAIPGDRRDEDIRAFAQIAATAFNEVIVREDANTRGPGARGEVATILRDASSPRAWTPDRCRNRRTPCLAPRHRAHQPDQLTVLLVDHPSDNLGGIDELPRRAERRMRQR